MNIVEWLRFWARSVSPKLNEAADEIDELVSILSEIASQIDQGGSDGKVFARDNCIQQARIKLSSYK